LEISRFLPSFLGKMAVFDKTESLVRTKKTGDSDLYIYIYIYIYIHRITYGAARITYGATYKRV